MKTEQERQELIKVINELLNQAYDTDLDNILSYLEHIDTLEDKSDIKAIRAAINEPKIPWEQVVKELFARREKLRAIAYSMDLLILGFYFWCPYFTIRIGGAIPDDNPYKYPGKIHSSTGIGIVLPGYKIFTSYQGSYDA
jgi:hypothetical protein